MQAQEERVKHRTLAALIVAALLAAVLGCGGGGGGKGGGASSPEALFTEIKTVDIDRMSQVLPYVAPDEQSLIVFAMDFAGSFAVAFSSDDSLEEEYMKLREKYKLPDQDTQSEEGVNLQDAEQVMAFAEKHYGKVNAKGFLTDVEAFLDKIPGEKTEGGVKWSEMKDLQVDGDTATATIVLEDGSTEEAAFIKVDGKWYFSQKALMF